MSHVPARAALSVLVLALFLTACGTGEREQSVVHPAGHGAQAVIGHWNTMLIVGVAVWVLVVGGMAVALFRRGDTEARRGPLFVAVAGAIIPAVIVVVVMAQSIMVLQETNPMDVGEDARIIEVEAHQYWWEIRYPDDGVVTANEIHIPVGERVRLELTSSDVVHSVWVPQLAGKVDMIPGSANTMWLEADEPGTYWGQCAEYCGLQHAQMRFIVVAHEPAEFDGWIEATSQPASEPSIDPDEDAPEVLAHQEELVWGREVFMSSSCVYCHAIQGTEAQGTLGPDLTHIASRQTLAAGVLENNRGNMAGWLIDPQGIKFGNEMPATDLPGDELQALLTYLESLE